MLNNLLTGMQPMMGNYDQGDNEYYVELDDEHPEEEDVIILSDEPIPREIGIRKGATLFNEIPQDELNEMNGDDDIIDYFLNNQEKFRVCEYFKRGNCKYAENCRYYHPKEQSGISSGNDKYTVDDECCICLEKIIANGKQFGVMDNCDHSFCLDCIRGWRATYDKRSGKHHFRTCPICRKNSYVVIPSAKMVKSGPEKDELVAEYKAVLKEIPCKHFNKGKGNCPFMNSCMYAHIMPDG